MHPSIPLLILSLIYTILILFLFITKEKVDTVENNVYHYLLITVILGILLDISGIYCHLYLPETSFIRWLVVKFYLAYLLFFIYFITIYLIILSDKVEMNSIKALNKKSRSIKTIKFVTGILIISLILNLILKFTYYKEGNSVYLFGENTIFVYALAGLGILSWLFIVIKNRKNIPIKKVVPILIFIFICIPVILLQLSNPEILVVTSLTAFLVNFMFHTIENPDAKLIEELNENRVLVEKTNEEKSNFLFKMTAEVRHPIDYIYETSNSLLNETDPEKLSRGISVINSSSRKVSYLINEVLNVSSMDIKKLKIMNTKYDFYTIINEIQARTNRENIKNLDIRYDISGDIPKSLFGDAIKIKQIIMTILSNSLKYTNKGFIELSVSSMIKYDVCRLIISIEDSGIGMDIAKVNDLLELNEEMSENDLRTLGKIDLNLNIVKKIVKYLGGSMMIKSEVGKGSEFIIVLDQKIDPNDNNNDSDKYKSLVQKRTKVLLVDDNMEELSTIENILNKNGISSTSTTYSRDCLDKINNNYKFDLIIINDEMPEYSAYETLKLLKEIKGFNTPVIVILDKKKDFMKQHYIEDGFKDYIIKEKLDKDVTRVINKYL